jgi:hypothetical protein
VGKYNKKYGRGKLEEESTTNSHSSTATTGNAYGGAQFPGNAHGNATIPPVPPGVNMFGNTAKVWGATAGATNTSTEAGFGEAHPDFNTAEEEEEELIQPPPQFNAGIAGVAEASHRLFQKQGFNRAVNEADCIAQARRPADMLVIQMYGKSKSCNNIRMNEML